MTFWGWSTQETRLEDGSVESRQRVWVKDAVVEWSDAGARRLARTYWRQVRASMHGLIAIDERRGGTRIKVRGGPVLLEFHPVRLDVEPDIVQAGYAIQGGLLTREAAGSISFRQERLADRIALESSIDGFHPTLAARPGAPAFTGELYKRVQATLHVAISREYFRRLIDEAAA